MKCKEIVSPAAFLLLCLIMLTSAVFANYKKGSDAYDKVDLSTQQQTNPTQAT